MSYCLIIPHYNHERQFLAFLPKLIALGIPLIVVDDGSSEQSLSLVEEYIQSQDDAIKISLVAHRYNRGKGAAVITGTTVARSLGYTHALQIDADGQHDVNDIKKFIELSETFPDRIICGRPVFDASVPKIRLYGRKITDFWVVLETLSRKVKDGLCGFRIYPLDKFEKVVDHFYLGKKMDFDTEILVKAIWLDVELEFLDTKVIYPEKSVSHFHYVRDNLQLIRLHVRLMFGMIVRLPFLLKKIF